MDRIWRQRVELIWGHIFQAGREGEAHKWIVAGVDYHFILEMPDVLDWVACSGVVVEGWSWELSRELALQDLFGEG